MYILIFFFFSSRRRHTRSSEAKHRADLRRSQENCNSSIQENGSSALKPLGVRCRTASGSDRPSVNADLSRKHKAPRSRSGFCNVKNYQVERAADRTLDTATTERESRQYK